MKKFLAAPSVVVLAACSTIPLVAPDVPDALRAPAGQVLFLEALGSGVQVYECAFAGGRHQWAFRRAELDLADRGGRPIGRHYYPGPTWEAHDGSRFVTEVKARSPAPDASAVPWLLATRKSGIGEGLFGDVASIQRVATVGGVAPAHGCSGEHVGTVARVPYTATFYLYRAAPKTSSTRAPSTAMDHWELAAANLAGLPAPLSGRQLAEGASAIARARAIGGTTERECELIDAVAQFYHLHEERTQDMRLVHFERALSRARKAHADDPVIAQWHDRVSKAAFMRAHERAEAAYLRRARP